MTVNSRRSRYCGCTAIFCAAMLTVVVPSRSIAQERQTVVGEKIHRSIPPAGAKTHTVVPAERYRAGWLKRWIFGSTYRDFWTTPIEATVLNLDSVGGGLTPLRTGGFGQSISLHFMGKDGRRYTVRSMDKAPNKNLAKDLKNTAVENILQDAISAQFPLGGPVCDALMDATGIIHSPHTFVVIPDSPRLGEYRDQFAGLIGTLQEVPSEGPDKTPGFAGSRDIKGSDNLWKKLEKGPRNRIDSRAFLKARLMDFLLNDKDRHIGQWRWARYPDGDGYTWLPIPEDRDQAFINFNGLVMALLRRAMPKQIKFQDKYPNLEGLSSTGWEMDREILAELEKPVWDSMATVIQNELPDPVIDEAVQRLPATYYEMFGEFLSAALKSRRDRLPEFASRYYRLISRQIEIQATDEDEYVTLEHMSGGDLVVRIGLAGQSGADKEAPYFQRTFHYNETKEVRLYMRGGDDRVEVLGDKARIKLRIAGGGGDDTFVNSSQSGGGKILFYDHRGDNRFEKGKGAKIDELPYKRPPGTKSGPVHAKHALDWGKQQFSFPILTVSPDLGAYVGIIFGRQNFGYRSDPYSSKHAISLGLATKGPKPFVAYTGKFRSIWGELDGILHLEYSGINVIRFHGFGNETEIPGLSEFYEVEQIEFIAAPALELRAGKNRGKDEGAGKESLRTSFTASLGPIIRYSETPLSDNEDNFIGTLSPFPYGAGSFGQVGMRVNLQYDSRDNPGFAKSGLLVQAAGAGYPEVWDVESSFGQINGKASAYLTADIPTEPTLALRAGGKKVWGTYPFQEAAFLGGPGNLRGFRQDRFAGDASVYGNAELRFGLTRIRLIIPAQLGLFGAADVGRVYFDGDPNDADKWHTGAGGGFWLSFMDGMQTLSVAIMNGDDLTGVYLNAGFMF